jgi:hypothetical protein
VRGRARWRFITAESARDLADGHHADATVAGIVLAAVALLVMPLPGWAKHRLAAGLGSPATAGEGTQNYLCAAPAVTAAWPGVWWADPSLAWASPPSRPGKASSPGAAMTAADPAIPPRGGRRKQPDRV